MLLTNKFILTAAHCRRGLIFDYGDYAVMGSRLKFTTLKPEDKHTISPDHHFHPKAKYFRDIDNPRKGTLGITIYDLMILQLVQEQLFCSRAFARLPTLDINDNFLIGKELLMSGWGSTLPITRQQMIDLAEHGKPVPILLPGRVKYVQLPYLRASICKKRLTNLFTIYQNVIGEPVGQPPMRVKDIDLERGAGLSMMCTSMCTADDLSQCQNTPDMQRDACKGDSGGNLLNRINHIYINIIHRNEITFHLYSYFENRSVSIHQSGSFSKP